MFLLKKAFIGGVVDSWRGRCSIDSMGAKHFKIIAVSCYHCRSIEQLVLTFLLVNVDLRSQSQSILFTYPF